MKDPRVKFAAYRHPHPLSTYIEVTVIPYKEAKGTTSQEIIKSAFVKLEGGFTKMAKAFEAASIPYSNIIRSRK